MRRPITWPPPPPAEPISKAPSGRSIVFVTAGILAICVVHALIVNYVVVRAVALLG